MNLDGTKIYDAIPTPAGIGSSRLRAKFNAASQVAEIFLYDTIGADFGGNTDEQVAMFLADARSYKTIVAHINSPGGDVFQGLAIRSLFLQSGKKLIAQIDGLAASIASIIPMGFRDIQIAEGGRVMIHKAWALTAGNDDELMKLAEILRGISADMAEIYSKQTKQPAEKMLDMMTAETWMNHTQSVKEGFATGVLEAPAMAASIDPARFKYKNIPEQYLPGYQREHGIDPLASYKEKILTIKGAIA